ncbi:hypothetical protein Vqi01_18990 [Micromonospora qiuiae]|uniref:Trypsin-co-occurring domain-containing protein n=1 Tax=Micromonospora qiuiae TaxID=502268 RepID=A0ABQ4J980_9ACTN|nr:hypothetical protein Vqi01_18990 [Micromonospora qiuiae]
MTDRSVVLPVTVAGVELQVEVARPVGSEEIGRGEMVRDAVTDAFDRAQDAIVAVAASTVGTIAQLGKQSLRPDEVQVKFGLKFSASGSVIIAGASSEATMEVALTYRAAAEHQPDGA